MEDHTIKINNLDKILSVLSEKQSDGLLCFEHLGDLSYYLDKFDKKREVNDDDLRKALLILIGVLVDKKIVKINFDTAFNFVFPPPDDKSIESITDYINKNWGLMDIVDRYYLISFEAYDS